jgi:hydroxymethylglutaryl-CoA reductase (NADPH)
VGSRDPRRRERPWPHRNTPEAIAHRRRALMALPGWRPEDGRIFPEREAEALMATQEAFTGQMVLPVAVVGPLNLTLGRYETLPDGQVVQRGRQAESVLVPLAHTEGGLSVSLQRGILAANRDGGIRTYVLEDGMTRDTCFTFGSVAECLAAASWIQAHVPELVAFLADPPPAPAGDPPVTSRHARLVAVRTHILGTMLHVLYRFVTGEAAGPNMITRNTFALNQEVVLPRLRSELGLVPERVVLEANMGGDKKPSALYFGQGGHGKTVVAEVTLSRGTLRHLLHVTAEEVLGLAQVGLHGAHESGMQSFAFTPASVVAAMFAVTGQDLGMVGTSSMAHITARPVGPGAVPLELDPSDDTAMRPYREGGVHLSLRFPGLEVGTVGGGTVLPCAETYLRLMGCQGPGSAHRLAQIIAGAALALEISAGASMASPGSREFFRAHWRRGGIRRAPLGPGQPVSGSARPEIPRR